MKYHNYHELLENNKNWVDLKKKENPNYFENLAVSQNPPFLYIGCSDSRMPLDTYTQTQPGEMFVHRNIANQISLTDMNILSVFEYALLQLKIKHIIICGHYECGGIYSAYTSQSPGIVENWLRPIKDIIISNKEELDKISILKERLNRVSELNVLKQIENLLKTSILERVLKADKKNELHIHGWVLELKKGTIKELELPIDDWKRKGLIPNYHNL